MSYHRRGGGASVRRLPGCALALVGRAVTGRDLAILAVAYLLVGLA
jgi:hypothetical protein